MAKEIKIEKLSNEDKMNLEDGRFCKYETEEDPEFAREQEENARELKKHVLTPDDETKLKEIWKKHAEEREKLKLEKCLNEIAEETKDDEIEKENNNSIKKTEEDIIQENVRQNLQKGMLSDKEEEEIKEKFENPDMRSVYDVLTSVLSLFLPYEPGENIDKSRKINDMDMINVAANLIPKMREVKKNIFYDKHKLPENKAEDVEKLAKDLFDYSNILNKEYVAPECKVDEKCAVPGDFDGICRDLMSLHARKNNDYGNAAHESYKEFGLISYVIRLNDKMKRLKSLTKPGADISVKGESIEDTLMDLAAYAIMAIESLRS